MIKPVEIEAVPNYSSASLLVNAEQQKRLTCDADILQAWKDGERFILYVRNKNAGTINKDEVSMYDHVSITFGQHGNLILYIAVTDKGWQQLSSVGQSSSKQFVRPGNIYKL